MKKTLFLLLIITSMATMANAQGDGPSLGVKAGANFSNVYDEQGEDFKADGKIGFAGGAFLSIPIFKVLGVQPEVLFSQKGFKATGTVLASPYSVTRTTNYIDVPLMVFVKPIPQLSILAGPQYSYLLKQKDVFEGAGITVLQKNSTTITSVKTPCALSAASTLTSTM